MKVYYQKIEGGNGCVCESIDDLKQAVVNEVEEFYCDSKTSEEKAYIVESIINKIKKLEIGNHIDFLGFQWGVKEMTREDYDNLGEFVGW